VLGNPLRGAAHGSGGPGHCRCDPPGLVLGNEVQGLGVALIQRQREAKGLKLIPLDEAPRRSLRALRRNEVLALRTGAPVVPCCVFRGPGGRFIAEVAPPVLPKRLQTGDSQRDIQAITQRLVETLEAWVRRHPDQWYPFRRMWLSSARLSS